jgi:hypothetical protein
LIACHPAPPRSKAFLVEYERGLRVIIFSANDIYPDCNNKSQGGCFAALRSRLGWQSLAVWPSLAGPCY